MDKPTNIQILSVSDYTITFGIDEPEDIHIGDETSCNYVTHIFTMSTHDVEILIKHTISEDYIKSIIANYMNGECMGIIFHGAETYDKYIKGNE